MRITALVCIVLVVVPSVYSVNIRTNEQLAPETQKSGYHTIKLDKKERSLDQQKELISFVTKTQNYFLSSSEEDQILNDDPSYSEDQLKAKGEILLATAQKVGNVHLYNFKNTQYTGKIGIGEQYNTFDVIFDTGSANIWIDSVQCNAPGCKQHKQYDGSKSKTFNKLGYDLEVQFGTGILSGEINQDDVFLDSVKVPNQEFAEIQKEMGQVFIDSHFDGIVGLAFPTMAAYGFDPLFDNIMKEKAIDHNMISFYYGRKDGAADSQMTVGAVNPDLYDGSIKYHDVVHEYYWTIKADNILLGDQDLGLCDPVRGCKVVADTGTSLLTGPSKPLDMLLNSIEVDDDCSNLAELPDIVFVIGGEKYPLSADEYVLTIDANGDEQPYVHKRGYDCAGAFMPLDVPEPEGPLWILGDIFLSKYYTVFNRDRNAVGFAKAKHYL